MPKPRGEMKARQRADAARPPRPMRSSRSSPARIRPSSLGQGGGDESGRTVPVAVMAGIEHQPAFALRARVADGIGGVAQRAAACILRQGEFGRRAILDDHGGMGRRLPRQQADAGCAARRCANPMMIRRSRCDHSKASGAGVMRLRPELARRRAGIKHKVLAPASMRG